MAQDESSGPPQHDRAGGTTDAWKLASAALWSRNRVLRKRLESAEQSARRLAQQLEDGLKELDKIGHELPQPGERSGSTAKAALEAATTQVLAKKREKLDQLASLAIEAATSISPVRGSMHQMARSAVRRLVGPKLGLPYQYAPRPMIPPPAYRPQRPATGRLPTIAIVTPSFGHAHFIAETLQSVIGQNYPALQYFVQDGGSQDETTEILRAWADRLAGWQSTPDNGQSHALNLGFANVSGDIMAYLNSDDLLLPDALACIADYFVAHPDVDVVYGNRLLIDENSHEIGRWVLPGHDEEAMRWADYIPQETLFWRRSIWERAGGRIDESFRFAMDWDLLMRFRDAGGRFAHIPRFLGAFRIHLDQKTSAEIQGVGLEEMNRIRKRVLGRVPSRHEIHKAVMPFMIRHMAADARIAALRRLRLA